MNREHLVQEIAKDPRIGTLERAEDALAAVQDTVTNALSLGRVIRMKDFGTFWAGDRPARTITHSDGTASHYPAARGVSFRPDRLLREAVNTPRDRQPRAAS